MRYKNLIIIGTSHIAPQSLKEVESTILTETPDIVALELDRKRISALASNKGGKTRWKDAWRVGIKGFLFSMIGAWVEQKLGQKTGVAPGSEMLLAFKTAQKVNARVALIDQDIEFTLKRFSKELSWKEKWFFLVDIFKGLILRKSDIDFDLAKVPKQETITRLIKKVRKRYPNIYKVLVTERNSFMAANLAHLLQNFPDKKIVAVVGAGHEKDIIGLIKQKLKE
jgi:pheromone shutdown-related protein TraB